MASNSTVTVGSEAAPATLNIGWSQNTNGLGSGSANGVLDTTAGNFTAELSILTIGRTSNRGSATGEFIVGDGVDINVSTVNIGVGTGASGNLTFLDNFTGSFSADTVNFNNGLFDFGNNTLTINTTGNIQATTFNLTGGTLQGYTVDYDDTTGTFNFTGGILAVNTFNGALNQNGGTVAPGNTPGLTTVNGDYNLASDGTYQVDILGVNAGSEYDKLDINGSVNLNADGATGGALDVILDFAPGVGNAFIIIDNDGADAISGNFAGLTDGATFDETFGNNIYTFNINYQGGDGNDVELIVTNVSSLSAPVQTANNAVALDVAMEDQVQLVGVMVADPVEAGLVI